jgi:hypothetical protein
MVPLVQAFAKYCRRRVNASISAAFAPLPMLTQWPTETARLLGKLSGTLSGRSSREPSDRRSS